MKNNTTLPNPLIAFIPVIVLICLLMCSIIMFGSDSLEGGSQVALLFSSAVCIAISMIIYHTPWKVFEEQLAKTLGNISITLFILLAVGMVSGSWMISGVVPTIIYYGVQILSPNFFLVSACAICAVVSLLSGSSWTTIATIGVALLGIGDALGIDKAWTAGAIISGAYFGDKMSPLSDTTILASSVTGTDLFEHIRYMMYTTVPTFTITLIIFLISGLSFTSDVSLQVAQYTEGLSQTFNISLWTLIVPVLTCILIARRISSLITLFLSAIIAGIVALILQPHILCEVSGEVVKTVKETADGIAQSTGCADRYSLYSMFRGLIMTYYGSTSVETGNTALNELVSTGGMAGMMNTVWLIISAMFFGSMMMASRMIISITKMLIHFVNGCFGLVSSTVGTCLFLNLSTGDQFISIVLAADMYKNAYKQKGFESRLLSRTTEDAATVTSVLIPWNTCGMAQSTVLGVPTVVYLPYCFFNIISPLMSMLVAAIGWKIKRLPVSEK